MCGHTTFAVFCPHYIADVSVVDTVGQPLVKISKAVEEGIGKPCAASAEREDAVVVEGEASFYYTIVAVSDFIRRRHNATAYLGSSENIPVIQNDSGDTEY